MKLFVLSILLHLKFSTSLTAPRKPSVPSLPAQALGSTCLQAHKDNRSCPIQVRDISFTLIPDNEKNTLYQKRKKVQYPENHHVAFDYQYNELVVPSSTSTKCTNNTKIVLLVQPIGVGIGRWYYDRLLHEFQEFPSEGEESDHDINMIFLAPDLLGCGTACNPRLISNDDGDSKTMKALPLITVENWSDQLIHLMRNYEKSSKSATTDASNNIEWCIVSNGGCVPIALEIAQRYVKDKSIFRGTLTNLILSATPGITSLNKPKDGEKIRKSYRTLSGIAGNVFWWYALRNDGAFIQNFSVKNLAARAENLGDEWRPQCVRTAKAFGGKSRFSTFAFLAGSLNGGNVERFETLKDHNEIKIDVITGGDTRRNPAKSWFWEQRKRNSGAEEKQGIEKDGHESKELTSLVSYLKDSGRRVNEIVVGGRRCPAHEDSKGCSKAIIDILQTPS